MQPQRLCLSISAAMTFFLAAARDAGPGDAPEPPPLLWIVGNCNADRDLDISDVVAALDFLFLQEEHAFCASLCDADGSGDLTISDPIAITKFLFDGEAFQRTRPQQEEVCGDGEDNDCNGEIDNDCTTTGAAVELTWDAVSVDALGGPEQVAGYKLHHGRSTGVYDTVEDVGRTLRARVRGLDAGARYYFAVTCYDRAGNESLPSREIAVVAGE